MKSVFSVDPANHWTDMILLYSKATYRSRKCFLLFCILGKGISTLLVFKWNINKEVFFVCLYLYELSQIMLSYIEYWSAGLNLSNKNNTNIILILNSIKKKGWGELNILRPFSPYKSTYVDSYQNLRVSFCEKDFKLRHITNRKRYHVGGDVKSP